MATRKEYSKETDHEKEKENAKERERPVSGEEGQSGFVGKRGHGTPTPPGGENPGGAPGDQSPRRLRHEDYADYPLDPRVDAGTKEPTAPERKKPDAARRPREE